MLASFVRELPKGKIVRLSVGNIHGLEQNLVNSNVIFFFKIGLQIPLLEEQNKVARLISRNQVQAKT